MESSIYLIGFMGSGKSTIGQDVAKILDYQWVDLDHYIEENEKASIKVLFEQYGEDYFRTLEAKTLKSLITEKKWVVSTGGGVIVRPENIELLKSQNTFYLKWDFDTLYKRIAGDRARPLVKSYEQLQELYFAREKLYERSCSSMIEGEGKSIQEISEEIIHRMEKRDENSSY